MKYRKLPVELVTKKNNIKHDYLIFKNDIGLSETIKGGSIWEGHIYKQIDNFNFEGTTIVDIGANIGAHTLPFADMVGDNGKVYAFEPQRIVFYQLCGNIIQNGYDNVLAYNIAISDSNGTTHVEKQNFYSEQKINIGDTHIAEHGDDIEKRTLDSFNLDNVSLIKMDIQGYESFALEGSRETILRCKPIILVEIVEEHLNLFGKSTEDIVKFFKSINYKLSKIEGWDYIAYPTVEHIYQNVDGWFDFESTYKEMVQKAENGYHFVEVGAWLGKSTSYMAVEIANSHKNIKFDAIDTWEGSPNEPGHQEFIDKLGMSLYDKFLDNMKPILKWIHPVKGFSEEISKQYKDDTLDFVFLDASHDYESVLNDIKCWFPKVKQNGIIAGHDYNDVGTQGVEWTGVVKAVNEFFGQDIVEVRKVHAGTWIVKKSDFRVARHIYQNIQGWFDFEDIYTEMVNRFDNALFVEVGAAWGKSSSYMAVEIANSKKNIKFDVIDKWEDLNGSFFEDYMRNIEPVKKYINPVKGYSTDIVNQYEDNSIDFIFIDASHEYRDVLNDINLWYHKVKPNGVIAGHDYNGGDHPGVVRAVNEFFGQDNVRISRWSWIFEKKIGQMPEHGRGGFLPAINYIKEHNIKNPVIVEIGTQRNFDNTGDGCSTTFFSWFVNNYGGKLYSVDIEDSYIENGKIELKKRGLLTNRVNLIRADGIRFFDNFNDKIDLLYLDAWDYRGTEEEKINSENSHLKCFLNAERHLNNNHLILIDDISDTETYIGKGHKVIPLLLEKDYQLILKEWQFLFSKNESPIDYLSGGLLGDFIDQLSVINENYIKTGRKGNLYLVDKDTVPSNFPQDYENYPWLNLQWRFGIDKAYNDLKKIVNKQEYINNFQIYSGEKLNNPIHLSSWRATELYNTSFYEIFKKEYNVEWASHKWLDLPKNDIYKDVILVSTLQRRYNQNYDFGQLKKYNKKIIYITTDIEEYEHFKNATGLNYELNLIDSLKEYWIAINSCYLFVTNVSSFSSVSRALHANAIYILPNDRDANHLKISTTQWFLNENEHNLKTKILVMSCCYNEEKILPFYLDYYTNFIGADKIVIYDGGSTDNSQNIIRQYPNTELIIEPQEKLDDRYLNDTRNNGWKKWRDEYDWIIVCDIDEFIYHSNLKQKLLEFDKLGVTIPLTEGFDMIDKKYPKFEKGKFITDIIKRGVVDNVFLNKKSIFRSSIDINYHIGSHGCDPTGPVKYSDNIEIKHLHYKWLGHKYLTKRSAGVADRLSDWNLSGGCGAHNRPFSLTSYHDFIKRCDIQAVQVLGEDDGKTPLYAFSHNYLINNWKDILNNQLNLLKTSGLYDELTILFMYVYGDDGSYQEFINIINSYDELMRIEVVRIGENNYEYPTLQALYDFAKYEIGHILYFHLKGVWSAHKGQASIDAVNSWRSCLEYFNIEKWKDCVQKLDDGYEVVGALYNYNEKEPLFSGNFWWTTTNYIKKLPRLEYIPDNDPDKNGTDPDWTWKRVECEKWINKIPNKYYNFYKPKDYGFYYVPLNPSDYKDEEYFKISVLIPTYNRFNLLKEAIQSVIDQNYSNIEILVCHDGPSDEYNKFKEENKYPNVFYYETPIRRSNYGAAQRNFLLEKVTGDFILHLDDDNIIYPGYLEKMTAKLDRVTGMVICKIHYNDKEWNNYILPLSDKIQDCEIDQLGILFNAEVGKMFQWDDYFGHDHRYINACNKVIKERNLSVKYIPDVLANHRFFGTVIPRVTIIHHCYLRYNWKDILLNQIFLMKRYGLYERATEIFATIYADDKNNYDEFTKIIEKEDYSRKWKVIILNSNQYEYDSLKFMKEYCKDKHAYICYFHLKGVISEQIEPNVGVPTWRKYLNYFTINKWEENIEHLKDHDVVCTDWNFNQMHQRYVMGGHFFWTKSEYVRTLPDIDITDNRYLTEVWITSNPEVKVWENFNCEKIGVNNLYLQNLDPTKYRNDIDNIKIEDNWKDDFRRQRINELLSGRRLEHLEWDDNGVNKLQGLKDLIDENLNKDSIVCEIGSFEGKSSELFALLIKEITCIDPWSLYNQIDDDKMMQAESKFDKLLEKYHNIKKIKDFSLNAVNTFNDYSFDCVYIDGDHDYEPVKKDILAWAPKVKRGGVISGHDYHFEGVRKALDELFVGIPIKVYSDKSWVVKIDDYRKDKNILFFHHSFLINNWKNIITDQLNLMKESGLYDAATTIFSSYYGDNEKVIIEFLNLIKENDPSNKFKFHRDFKNDGEFACLQMIYENCGSNAYIGYAHTKGAYSESISANIGIKNWRDYLNYFTITKWKESIDKLKEGYDITSVNHDYNDIHRDYIVGGFLWTTSEYIKTLPYPKMVESRFEAEIWIMKNKNKKIFEHFNSTKAGYRNLYLEPIPQHVYMDINKIDSGYSCYIITSHPNYSMSEDITKKTLQNIRNLGEKVILSAHCPVSTELQLMSDYFVYDKNNPLIKHDFYTQSWFTTEEYYALLNITKNGNNSNHALGVFLNYYNSLILAKNLGYKVAVCTNFDMVFSPEDKKIIDDKILQMKRENKRAFFMNTPEREGIHYKTIFFITEIDWFLNTFNYLESEEVYMEEMKKVNSNTNCLENFFYHSLKNQADNLLLQEINENDLFATSQINLFSLIEYNTILPVKDEPDNFVVWFSSANSLDSRDLNLNIWKNGSMILNEDNKIGKNTVIYKKFKFTKGDTFNINFRVTNNGEVLKDKTIQVNDEIFADIKSYGEFIDKKGMPII